MDKQIRITYITYNIYHIHKYVRPSVPFPSLGPILPYLFLSGLGFFKYSITVVYQFIYFLRPLSNLHTLPSFGVHMLMNIVLLMSSISIRSMIQLQDYNNSFEKIQLSFLIKISQQNEKEGTYFNIVNIKHHKLTANIANGKKKIESLYSKIRHKKR